MWERTASRVEGSIEEVAVTSEEMEMFVDLHPLTNTTPFTVLESMSVAKAMTLFRQVGLRHLLVVPKYQASGVSLLSTLILTPLKHELDMLPFFLVAFQEQNKFIADLNFFFKITIYN